MNESKYLTTQLLRETIERLDFARLNLIRMGTHALPDEFRARLQERQIDTSRINRSAVIELALLALEDLFTKGKNGSVKEHG